MKKVDFNEYRAEKDGIVTPRASVERVMECIDDVEMIVQVVKMKSGDLTTFVSDGFNTQHLGLLEIAKANILNWMRE